MLFSIRYKAYPEILSTIIHSMYGESFFFSFVFFRNTSKAFLGSPTNLHESFTAIGRIVWECVGDKQYRLSFSHT